MDNFPPFVIDVVAGPSPSHPVGENERALAILDIFPYSPGHALVLSKRHVPFWHDLTAREAADVFALAHRVARRQKAAFDPEFVCLMARGRRIPHTHVFLVPTAPGDVLDRYFNGLEKVQEGAGELAPLREHASREKAARRLRATPANGRGRRQPAVSRRTRKPKSE